MEDPKISDGLEEIKNKLRYHLKIAELATLFIEDPYRLQCVIDDHARGLEPFIKLSDEMVKQLEGLVE